MASRGPTTATGGRYGRLVAIRQINRRPNRWLFLCDCGTEKVILLYSVRSGVTRSCGCYHREISTTHGGSSSPEFNIWGMMRSRCNNPNYDAYDRYGGRGIRVCDRWENGDGARTGFECFLADMGPRPSDQHSIDRKDNDGDYEPDNCRWATDEQQANNMRRNVVVTYEGQQMTLVQACEKAGMRYGTVSERIRNGWTADQALSVPIGGRRRL